LRPIEKKKSALLGSRLSSSPQLPIRIGLKWGSILPYIKALRPRSREHSIKPGEKRGAKIFKATLHLEASP